MMFRIITIGRRTVFSGTEQQCADYMEEVGGNRFGYRIERPICEYCRSPRHAHCCKIWEDMPKEAAASMSPAPAGGGRG